MFTMAKTVMFLALWVTLSQVRGSHIPARMNKTIQNLLQRYSIPMSERFNGKPVFSRELLSGKTEAKLMFLGGVLETYEKLIDHMLKQLPTPSPQTAGISDQPVSGTGPAEARADKDSARTELMDILKLVRDLRKHGFKEQNKLLQGLQGLRNVQMDNRVIQSKALWELPWLYEEASLLSESSRMNKRRRRRQTRKIKAHPRV